MAKGVKILNSSGKLGVLLPGMGAVATTFVAGVYAVRKGLWQTDRFPDPNGYNQTRQTHGEAHADDQGICPVVRS